MSLALLLFLCISTTSADFTCNTTNSCQNNTYICLENQDCNIGCFGDSVCSDSTFNCPVSGDCFINCDGPTSCINAIFNCADNQDCEIISSQSSAMKKSIINGGNNSTTILRTTASGGSQRQESVFNGGNYSDLIIYAAGLGTRQFHSAYINCPRYGDCNISAIGGSSPLYNTNIIAQEDTNILHIRANRPGSLSNADVYCPLNGKCIVKVLGASNIVNRLVNTNFYVAGSFNDLYLQCDHDVDKIVECYGDNSTKPTMFCGESFSDSCTMKLVQDFTDQWQCVESNSLCIPTTAPTFNPTNLPTTIPTTLPSNMPTFNPTMIPTFNPTNPTMLPSNAPSNIPSNTPSSIPSNSPSIYPTTANKSNIDETAVNVTEFENSPAKSTDDHTTEFIIVGIFGVLVFGCCIIAIVWIYRISKKTSQEENPEKDMNVQLPSTTMEHDGTDKGCTIRSPGSNETDVIPGDDTAESKTAESKTAADAVSNNEVELTNIKTMSGDELEYVLKSNNLYSQDLYEKLTKNNIDVDSLRNDVKQNEIDELCDIFHIEFKDKLNLRKLWRILNENEVTTNEGCTATGNGTGHVTDTGAGEIVHHVNENSFIIDGDTDDENVNEEIPTYITPYSD